MLKAQLSVTFADERSQSTYVSNTERLVYQLISIDIDTSGYDIHKQNDNPILIQLEKLHDAIIEMNKKSNRKINNERS